MKHILLPALLLLISSCGDPSSLRPLEKNMHEALEEPKNKDFNIDINGTYIAVLDPINVDTIGFSSGAVTINLNEDEMITNVRFAGKAPGTIHAQYIHKGGLCPGQMADSNMDGYIDAQEILPFTSETLIPLDSDLNSEAAGQGFFPLTDDWGSYIYSLTNSYHSLMSDLYDSGKLVSNLPLDLEERVVVIYGTLDSDTLPTTVETLPGLTANQTLPIACGVFRKASKIPGTYEPAEEGPKPASRPSSNTSRGNAGEARIPGRAETPQRPHGSGVCRDKACLF